MYHGPRTLSDCHQRPDAEDVDRGIHVRRERKSRRCPRQVGLLFEPVLDGSKNGRRGRVQLFKHVCL